VQSGTRLLNGAEAQPRAYRHSADQPSADQPGADQPSADRRGADQPAAAPPYAPAGTLLAVVPIPGTGTSLAIVGYPVTVPAAAPGAPGAPSSPDTADARSGLLLDREQRRVWTDGAEVTLTFQEFELLAFLSAHPATVFSRADLVRRVWQRDFAADSRTVDVHVSRLRHKLGPGYGKYLVTEYRVGYQFRPAIG